MSSDDDLRLNGLERYRKTSSRLALEVHSHCEVPAGCGGVVLRWRRPGAPLGILLRVYVRGLVGELSLDGAPLSEQRVSLTPGEEHVLSFVVDAPGADGFLLMRARFEPELASASRPEVLSQADGRWRAVTREPSGPWQHPGFDGADFVPLVEKPVPEPEDDKGWSWQLLSDEVQGLALASPASRAWVRWSFRVDPEGFS
jgi:hypothetical protein